MSPVRRLLVSAVLSGILLLFGWLGSQGFANWIAPVLSSIGAGLMLQDLEKVTHKITETKKELVYLESVLQENGVQIKDVEIEK